MAVTGTYGEPGKNTYPIPGIVGKYSNVVNATNGVTQIYQKSSQFVYTSIGTYSPATGKFTPDSNASLTQNQISIFSSQASINAIKHGSIVAATKAGLTSTQATQLMSKGVSPQVTPPKKSDPSKPNPQKSPDTPETFDGLETIENFGGSKESQGSYNPKGKQAWVYPTGLSENKQDYIKFDMITYGPRKGITGGGNLGQRTLGGSTNPKQREILGSAFLPIQPSITDQNTVDWQNDTINPLQLAGASMALAASSGNAAGAVESSVGEFLDRYTGSDSADVKQYLRYWAAGKAVGTNLFSRIAGATVNPNLELLFNGPQLRPFNFTFRLSPRNQDEAKIVKGVIRFFKKGMSVARRADGLFLSAPNVFEIQYINGQTGKPHTSLNKIKVCALTNCTVDYTPDGSYATFYDSESTMTSYGLTLQFNELEPVFKDDYELNAPGENVIGY